MGDEDERQPELALQLAQQVEDLRLDRHVERGDRLVGDDQLRLQRERARDADALALAAGELVRVAVVVLGVEPDDVHQLLDAALALALALLHPVDHERLADDRADRLARVQRRVRVLEDHLHLAAQRLELCAVRVRDLLAVEADRAATSARAAAAAPARSSTCRSPTRRPGRASRRAMTSKETPSTACTAPTRLLKMMPLREREVLDEVAHLDEVVAHAAPSSTTSRRASSGALPAWSSCHSFRRTSAVEQARDAVVRVRRAPARASGRRACGPRARTGSAGGRSSRSAG